MSPMRNDWACESGGLPSGDRGLHRAREHAAGLRKAHCELLVFLLLHPCFTHCGRVLRLVLSGPKGLILRYLFADCALDSDRRELRRGEGSLVGVEPQVFDLLVYLICNRERLVSRDDLIASIWQGRIVSESALNAHIHAARSAIGDNGKEQRLIKTLARKGVRFVGNIHEDLGPLETAAGTAQPRSQASGQALDRGAAVRQYERRSGTGVLCRRHLGGPDYGARPHPLVVRHRPQLDVRLQTPRGRCEAGLARAWRPLRAGRQRAPGRQAGCASARSSSTR